MEAWAGQHEAQPQQSQTSGTQAVLPQPHSSRPGHGLPTTSGSLRSRGPYPKAVTFFSRIEGPHWLGVMGVPCVFAPGCTGVVWLLGNGALRSLPDPSRVWGRGQPAHAQAAPTLPLPVASLC